MAGLFKVPAPVAEMKRRLKRALSPQPSTSAAPEVAPKECVRRQILHSVYEHLHESIRLSDIGQLRGLKSGRRRGRWRRIHKTYATRSKLFENLINNGTNFDTGLAVKFSDAMKLMEPLLMDEILTQQSQHTLVASALDHFANVINHIVDDAEGASTSDETRKRTTIKRMFEDFEDDQPAILDKDESDGDSKDEDESARAERIRFETAAAIFALLQEQHTTRASDTETAHSSRFSGNIFPVRFPGDDIKTEY